MLKIWGRNNSINVQKVMWAVGELGLAHERIDAGAYHGVVDSAEYQRMNPNRLVPTIDDDGFILWESHAIVRYLAATYGEGGLWPVDTRQRADADRWMDWMETALVPSLRTVFWQLVRTTPENRDAAAIEAGVTELAGRFRILEAALEGRPFVAGDSLTMGDIPLGCAVYRYLGLNIDRPDLPNVETWYRRLSERWAYRVHVMVPIN